MGEREVNEREARGDGRGTHSHSLRAHFFIMGTRLAGPSELSFVRGEIALLVGRSTTLPHPHRVQGRKCGSRLCGNVRLWRFHSIVQAGVSRCLIDGQRPLSWHDRGESGLSDGKGRFFSLNQRYQALQLPEIELGMRGLSNEPTR